MTKKTISKPAANSGFALCGQFGSLANLSYFYIVLDIQIIHPNPAHRNSRNTLAATVYERQT